MTDVQLLSGKLGTRLVGDAPWTGAHVLTDTYLVDSTPTTSSLVVQLTNMWGEGRCNGLQLVRLGSCPTLFESFCDQGPVKGCDSTVVASGRPSLSNLEDFQLEAFGTANANGLFFFTTNGRQAVPWRASGTTMCLVPPVQRTTPLSTGTFPGRAGYLQLNFAAWTAAHRRRRRSPAGASRPSSGPATRTPPPTRRRCSTRSSSRSSRKARRRLAVAADQLQIR